MKKTVVSFALVVSSLCFGAECRFVYRLADRTSVATNGRETFCHRTGNTPGRVYVTTVGAGINNRVGPLWTGGTTRWLGEDSSGMDWWESTITVGAIPSGTGSAEVWFWPHDSSWLAQKIVVPNGFSAGTYNNATFTINTPLESGECASDGVVDLTDYTAVATAFNAMLSDPNNGGNPSSNWNDRADLNEDDIVDLADYTIVAMNFNHLDGNGYLASTPTNVISNTNDLYDIINNAVTNTQGNEVVVNLAAGATYYVQGRIDISEAVSGDPIPLRNFSTDAIKLRIALPVGKSITINGNGATIVPGVKIDATNPNSFRMVNPGDCGDLGVDYINLSAAQKANIKVIDLNQMILTENGQPVYNGTANLPNLWRGGWPRMFSNDKAFDWSLFNFEKPVALSQYNQPFTVSVKDPNGNLNAFRMATSTEGPPLPDSPAAGTKWRRAIEVKDTVNGSEFRIQKFFTKLPEVATFPNVSSIFQRRSAVVGFALSDSNAMLSPVRSVTPPLNPLAPHLNGYSNPREVTLWTPVEADTSNKLRRLARGARYRFINEPSLLDETGEFYSSFNKLFIYAPAGSAESVYISLPSPLKPGQWMAGNDLVRTVPDQVAEMNFPRIAHAPLLFHNIRGSVKVNNLNFHTGVGMAMDVSKVNNLEVTGCTFTNFGQPAVTSRLGSSNYPFGQGLNLRDANNNPYLVEGRTHRVKLDDNMFHTSHRGHFQLLKSDFFVDSLDGTFGNTDSYQPFEQAGLFQYNGQGANVPPNVLIRKNIFERAGQVYTDGMAATFSPGVNFAHIFGNTFQKNGGAGFRYQGTNITVGGLGTDETGHRKWNIFDRCAEDMTDAAAVYAGRSHVDLGCKVVGNQFLNIHSYPEPIEGTGGTGLPDQCARQAYYPGLIEDFEDAAKVAVAGIYLDDTMSGQHVTDNTFTDCQYAFFYNGGRDAKFERNLLTRSGFMTGIKFGAGARSYEGTVRLNSTVGNDGPGRPSLFNEHASTMLARLHGSHNSRPGGATGLAQMYYGTREQDLSLFRKSYGWVELDSASGGRLFPVPPKDTSAATPYYSANGFFQLATPTSGNTTIGEFPLAAGQTPVTTNTSTHITPTGGWADISINETYGTSSIQKPSGWIHLERKAKFNPNGTPLLNEASVWFFRMIGNQFFGPENTVTGSYVDPSLGGFSYNFYGKVVPTGHNNVPFASQTTILPDLGEQYLEVHIPCVTYNPPVTLGGNPEFYPSGPLKVFMDKNGYFGLNLRSADGPPRIFVRLAYSGLWKQINFFQSTEPAEPAVEGLALAYGDLINHRQWNMEGTWNQELTLRYGDVNEDGKIDRDPNPTSGVNNGSDEEHIQQRFNGQVVMVDPPGVVNAAYRYDYWADLDRNKKVEDQDRDIFVTPLSGVAPVTGDKIK